MKARHARKVPAPVSAWPRLMLWGAAWFVAGVIAGHVLEAAS